MHAYKFAERFRWDSVYQDSDGTKGKMVKYTLHTEFDELFRGVDLNSDINQQITEKPGFKWKTLVFLLNLLNQIRNTDQEVDGDSADYIQSPVWSDKLGDYFDSRKAAQGLYKTYESVLGELPKNGDANGAYHIALKGREAFLADIVEK